MMHTFTADWVDGHPAVVERSARGAVLFVYPCRLGATIEDAERAAVDMQAEYDREHPTPSLVAA